VHYETWLITPTSTTATEDKEEERAVSDWAGMRNFEEWLGD
jgi:hypothetical protein